MRETTTASIAKWLVLIREFIGKEISVILLKSLEEKDRSLDNVVYDFAERSIQN